MQRRSFLGAILGTMTAPSIVKANNLMSIVVPKFQLYQPVTLDPRGRLQVGKSGQILVFNGDYVEWQDPPEARFTHEFWTWQEDDPLMKAKLRAIGISERDIAGDLPIYDSVALDREVADITADGDLLEIALQDRMARGEAWGNIKCLDLPMFKDFAK